MSSSPDRNDYTALGLTLFTLTTALYAGYLRKNRPVDDETRFAHLYRRLPRHHRFSIKYTDRHNGKVGSRGQAALSPAIPYLKQFLTCLTVCVYFFFLGVFLRENPSLIIYSNFDEGYMRPCG